MEIGNDVLLVCVLNPVSPRDREPSKKDLYPDPKPEIGPFGGEVLFVAQSAFWIFALSSTFLA